MKIILLGSTGLIGSGLLREFKRIGHEVLAPAHAECDVTIPHALEGFLKSFSADFIVNATGYTAVDKAESDSIEKEECFALNTAAPQLIAQTAAAYNVPVVYISTDYVFDGTSTVPYTEDAAAHPLSVYGESKFRGERSVLEASATNVVVRTAWPFGGNGKNFVDTILDKASQGIPLTIVTDQLGSPTFVPEFCASVAKLLESKPHGVYHIVNEGQASWFELATEVFDLLGVPQQIAPILTEKLAQAAQRPKYSVLANTRTTPLRHWKTALTEYLMDKQIIFPV